MERECIKEAPTVTEAVDAALEELGVQQDAVAYEVLEEPGRKMFGIGGDRGAKVRVWVKEEYLAELEAAKPAARALTPEVGTFHSVHPMSTVMELVCLGMKDQLSTGEFVVAEAGVIASIYVSELTNDRIVVTAGNTLDKYFSFTVELTSGDDGTTGHAYLDRPFNEINRWMGNAMEIAFGIQRVLTELRRPSMSGRSLANVTVASARGDRAGAVEPCCRMEGHESAEEARGTRGRLSGVVTVMICCPNTW